MFKLNAKLTFALLASVALAACSSTTDLNNNSANLAFQAEDPSFTNQGLTGDLNAKIYNGYSANDLRYQNNTVLFGFDKYVPEGEFIALVAAHAEFMKKTGAKVLLEGYTDERGTPEYNITLGSMRAKETAALLQQYGVKPENIRQLSYGETRPAVLGHTEAAYSKNRRVVFNYEF